MEGTIIAVGIIALVVIVVFYLFRDTGFFKNLNKFPEDIKTKISETNEEKTVEIVAPPTIICDPKNGQPCIEAKMTKSEYKIGRGKNNDLVLADRTVEKCHAVIYKRYHENEIYYELVNLAKKNPIAYFNQEKETYEFLGKKQGQGLAGREAFYLGNVKVKIFIPVNPYIPTETDQDLLKANKKLKELAD